MKKNLQLVKIAALGLFALSFTACDSVSEALETTFETKTANDQFTLDVREGMIDAKEDDDAEDLLLHYADEVNRIYTFVYSEPISLTEARIALDEEDGEDAPDNVLDYYIHFMRYRMDFDDAVHTMLEEKDIKIDGNSGKLLVYDEVNSEFETTIVLTVVKNETDVYAVFSWCSKKDKLFYKDDCLKMAQSLKILKASGEADEMSSEVEGEESTEE